jgi:hypothetical protein
MPNKTQELGLNLALDNDDAADYEVVYLADSLTTIDGLFNQGNGHTHSGPHQGGLIGSAAIGGPMDLPDWFRSTGQRSAFASQGAGLELYWSGAAGVVQAYDRGGGQYRDLILEGATIHLAHAGTDALVVDGSGNVDVANSLTSGGQLTGNSLQVNLDATITGNLEVSGANLYLGGAHLYGSGNDIHAAGSLGADSNYLLFGGNWFRWNGASFETSGGLQVNGSIVSTADVTAQGSLWSTAGNLWLSGSGHGLQWDSANNRYSFAGPLGVKIGDWLGLGVDRNDSYQLTLPNKGGTDHTGKGIATGWDSYSSRAIKENIAPIDDALAIVLNEQLRGVRYDSIYGGARQLGFIADDFLPVVPEVVGVDAYARPLSMDYGRVTAILWEAVRQLASRLPARTAQEGQQAA